MDLLIELSRAWRYFLRGDATRSILAFILDSGVVDLRAKPMNNFQPETQVQQFVRDFETLCREMGLTRRSLGDRVPKKSTECVPESYGCSCRSQLITNCSVFVSPIRCSVSIWWVSH